MLKRLHLDSDDIALALILWICALPLIALIAIPLFGFKVASASALGLIFVFVILCWGAPSAGECSKARTRKGSRLRE